MFDDTRRVWTTKSIVDNGLLTLPHDWRPIAKLTNRQTASRDFSATASWGDCCVWICATALRWQTLRSLLSRGISLRTVWSTAVVLCAESCLPSRPEPYSCKRQSKCSRHNHCSLDIHNIPYIHNTTRLTSIHCVSKNGPTLKRYSSKWYG